MSFNFIVCIFLTCLNIIYYESRIFQESMDPRLSKFLRLFFAACFLALQFHPVGDTQLEQSAKRIFHIEDVSKTVIDKRIDNSFIDDKFFQSKHAYLSQQNTEVKQQRQFLGAIERQVEHAFRQFMQECLADPCAQSTIEAVAERKQEVKKQQDGDKEPKDEDETLTLP